MGVNIKVLDKITIPIVRSVFIFDVKANNDVDLKLIEMKIRNHIKDGLIWGESQMELICCGSYGLRILGVLDENRVCIEELKINVEEIIGVQSVDIYAYSRV